MNFKEYTDLFVAILTHKHTESPYDQEKYINYVRLNQRRQKRWLKTGTISQELKDRILKLNEKQNWVVITEPWCGDAAHVASFIFMLSELSPFIELDFRLRDKSSEIDKYLSKGSKAIPVLIIRDKQAHDLAVWGPRPEGNEILRRELKQQDLPKEEQKKLLQKWYNKDKGKSFQEELLKLIGS